MRMSTQRLFVVLCMLVSVVCMTTGCSSSGKVDPKTFGPVPSTVEIVEGMNARIEPLETLWSRMSIRVRGTYEDGKSYEEQGNGHLQIQRPGNISLTVRKLGELYLAYGANTEQYWMFNLIDNEHKTLHIGGIDQVTPLKASQIGMLVHPGQLNTLMGLVPIDLSTAGGTQWSSDGKSVGVSAQSPWGSYTLWIDPRTFHAVRSQAFDRERNLIATTTLTRYKDATIPRSNPVMVPGTVEIRYAAESDGFIRIELSEPAVKPIKSMVFNPKKLKRAYRIDETIDLDASVEQPTLPTNPNGD